MNKKINTFFLNFLMLMVFTLPKWGQGLYDLRVEPYDWKISSPEAQGMDSRALENAYQKAASMDFMLTLVIIKNGYLIGEQYFRALEKENAMCIASASKSFLNALVGIALEKGYLNSVDQRMIGFFPEYDIPDLDSRKREITIRHLLTMTSGYSDQDSFDRTGNWIRYGIQQIPLHNSPGDAWLYSTFGTHLLSAIITKVSGMSTRDFAQKYLFEPLGITVAYWHQDPSGIYFGGARMYFAPRDTARYGYLFLKNGTVEEREILSNEWIDESLQDYSNRSLWTIYETVEEGGYGYLWYLGKMGGYSVFMASGFAGQHIIVIPALDMVIVNSAFPDIMSETGENHIRHRQILQFIANYILTAILKTPENPPASPKDAQVTRILNRSLFMSEILHLFQWQPNPDNTGTNTAVVYRIYRLHNGNGVLLGEVDAQQREFLYRNVEENTDIPHTYGICTLTSDGRESVPAVIEIEPKNTDSL